MSLIYFRRIIWDQLKVKTAIYITYLLVYLHEHHDKIVESNYNGIFTKMK